MSQLALDPATAATAQALARAYLADQAPTFPTAVERLHFAGQLELALLDPRLTRQYLRVLDRELGRITPEGRLFEEAEIDRFAAEGLGWLPAERLALLAIDRGAVTAMAQLVVELWGDYWAGRAEPAALPTVARPLPPAASAPGAVGLMALGGRPPDAAPVPPAVTDRLIPVAPDRAVWLSGSPVPLTVVIIPAAPTDRGFSIKISPLTLLGPVRCTAWLAGAHEEPLDRGTRTKAVLSFAPPPPLDPRYFLAEYRSAQADVILAVALDGTMVLMETWAWLLGAAARALAVEDPARAATFAALRGSADGT